MEGSYLLTKELAEEAVSLVYPMFLEARDRGLLKRPTLHIVIMDPGRPYGCGCSFEEAILCEVGWGDVAEKYVLIAREKAELSWRTGLPAHVVQLTAPHLLTGRNTKWAGSDVRYNLVVGVSSLDLHMDQLFAESILSACKSMAMREMVKVMASPADYLRDYTPQE
jgi:hypothetical protein